MPSSLLRLSQADLEFLAEEAAPHFTDRPRLLHHLREDEAFRRAFITDENVVRRVMTGAEVLVSVSPALYFEVLLRQALKELEQATYTVETAGRDTVAVFDTREVVDLLSRPQVLDYLADMLASFTRVHSYVTRTRVRRGVYRRSRFSDMDIDSLVGLCATAEEESRLGLYKRIADVCLFVHGMFPEHLQPGFRHQAQATAAPHVSRRRRRSAEEYEQEGRRFYRMAGEHPAADPLDLSEVFHLLCDRFIVATKPLGFIARHYLSREKRDLFGPEPDRAAPPGDGSGTA